MAITTPIASKLNLRKAQVESVLNLLYEGSTIPFIARYRKDKTGALDEVQIQQIQVRIEKIKTYLDAAERYRLAIIKHKGVIREREEIEGRAKLVKSPYSAVRQLRSELEAKKREEAMVYKEREARVQEWLQVKNSVRLGETTIERRKIADKAS